MSTRSAERSGPGTFVGRSRELNEFRAALRAVAGGTSAVVRMTGEAGIGRTRLLEEFAAMAAAEGAAWLLTRTPPWDEEPLGPLLHAKSSGPLPLLESALAGAATAADHFEALVNALSSEARTLPLWLLIDDLHTADEATRGLTERLVAAAHHGVLRNSRVGLVLSLPAAEDTRELRDSLDLKEPLASRGWMTLEPLSSDELRRWLTTRSGSLPDDGLVRLLHETSRGNPRLISELLVLLDNSGRLGTGADRVFLIPVADEPALPRDLNTLLAGRIGGLSDSCRRALTLAAFLGNEFETTLLADLLGQTPAALERLVDEAADAFLVERRANGRVAFRHREERRLFYTSPDEHSREATHLHICEGLISEFGSHAADHCLAITHHLLRAGDRADPALILHYAPQAAEVASRHHSHFLAGRYFEAAARVGGDRLSAARQAELFMRAGEAFQRWSDGTRSNACLHEAVSLYERCDDLPGHARALQGLLRNLISFGQPTREAPAVAAHLQGLLGALPEHHVELRVRVHDTLASYYHHIARYDIAEAYAQTAMTIARNSSDPALRCIPVTSLALAQMEQLRLTEAKTTWLEGLSFDRAAGAQRYEGLHLQRLPVPLYCMAEIQEAARYNQASYRHNQSIGNTGELSLNLTVDVMIANLRGDFDAAISAGREGMRLMAVTRYLWSAPSMIAGVAYALAMRERFDEAEAIIAHLSTDGLIFEDTTPYRGLAARLLQLVAVHRGGPTFAAHDSRQKDDQRGPRSVRIGSLPRLCGEAELALFQLRPERLSGVHDTLEFIHRRGVALSLGWCCSVPRALAVSTALRRGMSRAAPYFEDAGRLAERTHAPLEKGRVELYRGLADLACGANLTGAQPDLESALDCFERFDAPALARLAEDALSRAKGLPKTS